MTGTAKLQIDLTPEALDVYDSDDSCPVLVSVSSSRSSSSSSSSESTSSEEAIVYDSDDSCPILVSPSSSSDDTNSGMKFAKRGRASWVGVES